MHRNPWPQEQDCSVTFKDVIYFTFLTTFFSARITRGPIFLTGSSATTPFCPYDGSKSDCPAQTPSKNIQRKRQKAITAIPATALFVNSNLSFLTWGFRLTAIRCVHLTFLSELRGLPYQDHFSEPPGVPLSCRAWPG